MDAIVVAFVFIFQILHNLCEIIGYYGVFKKSGRKGWYALFPGIRDYQLAVTAEREEEGKTYFILCSCSFLANTLYHGFAEDSAMRILFSFVSLAFQISSLFYGVRIISALCHLYNRSKKWVPLWLFFSPIVSLIWGFNKKFQPAHKAFGSESTKAAKISGASVEALQTGLTINLTDRNVIDFFKRRYLLKDIHLSIPTGHMVLLLGGSGAGKTTFLNAITGYEKANAEVILNGNDVYGNYESMKYDLGFVPQQDLMRDGDTVFMTLKDAAGLRLPKNMSFSQRRDRINEMLEKFGLSSVKHHLVEKLSGGQRKRLSIAMEFISDPALFILDEPDSGLDGIVARNLFEGLRSIADEGRIVIVITHTPDRVIDLFDDVIVLAKDADRTGRLSFYGSIGEAYSFFGKGSMEEILLSINQKDEGGEGRADEFIEKYSQQISEQAG
ncbi:MAG: ABC transporter ATP-binding protein [Lachnospiraceae bacterium]|nr:ABC transporter ATP-binding protein [Lachnospiraceae bacterium]